MPKHNNTMEHCGNGISMLDSNNDRYLPCCTWQNVMRDWRWEAPRDGIASTATQHLTKSTPFRQRSCECKAMYTLLASNRKKDNWKFSPPRSSSAIRNIQQWKVANVKRYQKQYNDFSFQWFFNCSTIRISDYMSVGEFNMQNKFEVYLFSRLELRGGGGCLRTERRNFSCGWVRVCMMNGKWKQNIIHCYFICVLLYKLKLDVLFSIIDQTC